MVSKVIPIRKPMARKPMARKPVVRKPVIRRAVAAKKVAMAKTPKNVTSQQKFLEWLQKRDPFTFNVIVKRHALKQARKGTRLSAIDWSGLFTTAVDTIKNVAPQYLQLKQQKKILDVQIDRAKKNLPPLDATQYSPPVKVEVATSPEGEAAASRIAQSTIKTGMTYLLPIIAVVGLGFMLMMRKR